MQSGQPASSDHFDHDELDTLTIPDLASAWQSSPQVLSSVRRPSILPTAQSYHEAIEPQAIFELDEEQQDGSVKTIFVVAFSCKRCRSQKQACSRAQPACVRCRKARASCEVIQEGYQRLPGPKIVKLSVAGKQSASTTRKNSEDCSSASRVPSAKRSRARRKASSMESLSQASLSDSERADTPGSKRSLSPGSDSAPPRKRTQAKTIKTASRKGKARAHTNVASKGMDIECPEGSAVGPSSQVASANQRSALKWVLVNNSCGPRERTFPAQKDENSMLCNTPIPRVWTNSLNGLLTVFPELAKSVARFSWLQSEIPTLLLDTNYAQGHWINDITLTIDLVWDFSCYDFELEPVDKSDMEGSIQPVSCQPAVPSMESTSDCIPDMMDFRYSQLPPGNELFPACASISAPQPTHDVQMSQPDCTIQYERRTCEHLASGSLVCSPTQNDPASAVHSPQGYSSHSFSLENPLPPNPHSTSSGSCAHHTTSQADSQPRIPLNKPPEVETLLNSYLRSIPLLLWMPHNSELLPCNLPSEYACLCMGLFFISGLCHRVIQYGIPSATEFVQGRVCWSVTLQWAPGGEDALFNNDLALPSGKVPDSTPLDTPRDIDTLHPWWFCPTNTLSQTDDTPYRPRDLRMQFFSLIPLDLLAEFHPSESFPRGWFCKSCGMINTQQHFRHQICSSTRCESTREKCVPQGKADSLSSLRDHYQSSILIRPTNDIPSVVASDCVTWDDGMQSWIHSVKDGVILCHVFTGNQEHLQEDATVLLEKIQCEVLLRKENTSNLYFTHTTRLSHSNDKSEAMVPVGTPDCVRIAYYTLCDVVNRYGEMDKPRFGEIRVQAWVNSGSRKGGVFRASKSPVVVHCLGAEVVLNFIPQGGYKDTIQPVAPDKGKGRAQDEGQIGSPATQRYPSPSCHLEQGGDSHMLFISGPEANESVIVAEHVDQVAAAMDTAPEYRSLDADGTPDTKVPRSGPGTEMPRHEVIEPKEGRARKKNKVAKDKSKTSVPEISMTLVHGDCIVLYGDNFECQMVRTGTTILVIGFPEEA